MGRAALVPVRSGAVHFINSSARAKKSSREIFPAATSARIERCTLYSLFSIPALLCNMRQALRRSMQKSTNCRESERYSTSLLEPCTLIYTPNVRNKAIHPAHMQIAAPNDILLRDAHHYVFQRNQFGGVFLLNFL